MDVIDHSNGDSVTVRLQHDELLGSTTHSTRSLNGPASIEGPEFHTRMGVEPAEARALLTAVSAAFKRLQRDA